MHGANTGYDGGECAHDRHETGDHDDFPAVLVIQRFGLQQVLFLEEQRVLTREKVATNTIAKRVPHTVASYCCNETPDSQDGVAQFDLEGFLESLAAGDDPCREQQAIARQEKPKEQTGLGENDEKDTDVPDGRDKFLKIEIDEMLHDEWRIRRSPVSNCAISPFLSCSTPDEAFLLLMFGWVQFVMGAGIVQECWLS